jgi:hypothetical protein
MMMLRPPTRHAVFATNDPRGPQRTIQTRHGKIGELVTLISAAVAFLVSYVAAAVAAIGITGIAASMIVACANAMILAGITWGVNKLYSICEEYIGQNTWAAKAARAYKEGWLDPSTYTDAESVKKKIAALKEEYGEDIGAMAGIKVFSMFRRVYQPVPALSAMGIAQSPEELQMLYQEWEGGKTEAAKEAAAYDASEYSKWLGEQVTADSQVQAECKRLVAAHPGNLGRMKATALWLRWVNFEKQRRNTTQQTWQERAEWEDDAKARGALNPDGSVAAGPQLAFYTPPAKASAPPAQTLNIQLSDIKAAVSKGLPSAADLKEAGRKFAELEAAAKAKREAEIAEADRIRAAREAGIDSSGEPGAEAKAGKGAETAKAVAQVVGGVAVVGAAVAFGPQIVAAIAGGARGGRR